MLLWWVWWGWWACHMVGVAAVYTKYGMTSRFDDVREFTGWIKSRPEDYVMDPSKGSSFC